MHVSLVLSSDPIRRCSGHVCPVNYIRAIVANIRKTMNVVTISDE